MKGKTKRLIEKRPESIRLEIDSNILYSKFREWGLRNFDGGSGVSIMESSRGREETTFQYYEKIPDLSITVYGSFSVPNALLDAFILKRTEKWFTKDWKITSLFSCSGKFMVAFEPKNGEET